MTDATKQDYIKLNTLEYFLRPKIVRGLLSHYEGNLKALFDAPPAEWQTLIDFTPAERQHLTRQWPQTLAIVDRTLELMDRFKVKIISIRDPQYPALLRQITDPPQVIFARGNTAHLALPHALAVVGSRAMTEYGKSVINALVGAFAPPLSIVSGMAFGVDAYAHALALRNGLPTIGVLGCGIDQVYPPQNQPLYGRMLETGLLISEFPLGAPPLAHHFPRRNRIIAGVTQGVLVIEAALRSGTMVTARFANDYGREVFAVPGSIHSPVQSGCHQLLAQGAKLVASPRDIVDELPEFAPYMAVSSTLDGRDGEILDVPIRPLKVPKVMVKKPKKFSPHPNPLPGGAREAEDRDSWPLLLQKLYGCFSEKSKWHIDDLAETLRASPPALVPHLFTLREKGVVTFSPGQWYEVAAAKSS